MMENNLKPTSFRCLRWLLMPCLALVFGAAGYYYIKIYNPLPDDERMIENFKANRADFVEAVRRFREYPLQDDKDASLWFLEGDTLEVYKRAGIDSIDARGVWLPDPYSIETDKKIINEINKGHGRALIRQHGTLLIRPASTPRIDHPKQMDDHTYRRNTLLFGTIWKDYYFFPLPPRIEMDELLGPVNHLGVSQHSRVLPSLNRLPVSWERGECVFHQIEPQWFIRMCSSR
ncbi:MAG: hypothetical protein LBE81_06215 [Azonexus sp.]|jgi:hypothetical protein|uniref:hypothetical protein n=1 Tax=Azonexus sp. TaxID=1872668 RepID=UPI0028389941|nr:hypothetical protein [Azonexus sp.]MDR0776216.1 hypothetical protein [Azonexus sp.]